MIPPFLRNKIAFYYLSQKITPFTKRSDLQYIVRFNSSRTEQQTNDMIETTIQKIRNKFEPLKIRGKRTFIDLHECMVCENRFSENELDHRVNFYACDINTRLQILFCRNKQCQEIAQYSYIQHHIDDDILFQDDYSMWNPFSNNEEDFSILQIINYYDEETQKNNPKTTMYIVSCYRSFIDAPNSNIYFMIYYETETQGFQRMVTLQKILTDNPKFLENLQQNPEKLDFTPHLFFSPEKNLEIKEKLQEIRNHFQLPQTKC